MSHEGKRRKLFITILIYTCIFLYFIGFMDNGLCAISIICGQGGTFWHFYFSSLVNVDLTMNDKLFEFYR